ncbi:MAG: sensor histidine kinase [Roseateles asaccharophilus]|uniref:histidine kinase n=1 Tax=Roseateles asaccharophilus TaxID=582607 RepID=A0A4R6MSG2_9BURK|nr:ATP-binding protein [Roseateles asaccharophilus]MDN3546579.1 ATP-binding protein [Roseateles asaccharophilus]TDP04999.1 histidine kinase/DNA gyrase B/HSP90-like ATPase [Roseateles asaccharophilus]
MLHRLNSLRMRLALGLATMGGAGLALHAALSVWPLPQLLKLAGHPTPAPWGGTALTLTGLALLPLAWWLAGTLTAPLSRLLRALEGAVLSYHDGEFGSSVAAQAPGASTEMLSLMRLHSELGQALREQRQHLAQRELLLDTVVQNTPVALLLSDASGHVVYTNIAARQLLAEGRSLQGSHLDRLLERAPAALREAMEGGEDGLFSVDIEGTEERFHLSRRQFQLQGRPHRLHLLRRMTRELSRQEVASWKRVIRVISHELNNSLAPISSLSHSGAELARRGQTERLPQVFASIGERAAHLHDFLSGYAQFAKLPAPQPGVVAWAPFLERLAAHYAFVLEGEAPTDPGRFDAAQIEQALINLLKNAHESGGNPADIRLQIQSPRGRELRLEVLDRGPGMSETVLAQALLPFYSTKRSGTGLGLALAREIAEAHGGRITLANRSGGGLGVSLILPR